MSWRDKVQAMREGVNYQNTPSLLLTKPTEPGCVSFGSTPPPAISKNQGAANDPGGDSPDPDRWCWPHSMAMNGAEIDTFTQRLHQFTRRGLAEPEAETRADKLVTRDRESDDRRLCLECLHLKSGGGRWGCNQWQRAGLGASGLPADLVRQLQRCDGFNDLQRIIPVTQ